MFRFEKRKGTGRVLAASAVVFALLLTGLWSALDSVSEGTQRRQRESLERAINRCITWCYAVEGSYPESLEDMKENYGLCFDERQFFVDYRSYGSNMLPEVTILKKGS